MSVPAPGNLAEDPLAPLLGDPSGREASRRGRIYAVQELRRFLRSGVSRRLERERPEERARFDSLAPRFPDVLRSLLTRFPAPPAEPTWAGVYAGLVQLMVPNPPFAFLRCPPLSRGGAYWDAYDPIVAAELRGVEAWLGKNAVDTSAVLRENAVGGPYPYDRRYPTSSMLVQHAVHVCSLWNEGGVRPSELRRVVEWGGGYGSMARILFRFQPRLSYVILDTPVMLALQWLFLSTVLGPDRVVLPGTSDGAWEEGRVYLRNSSTFGPVGDAPDLFLSTYALSESPVSLVEGVAARQFFGAKHLWVAYTPTHPDFPQWRILEEAALRSGARVVPHPVRPKDRYACR